MRRDGGLLRKISVIRLIRDSECPRTNSSASMLAILGRSANVESIAKTVCDDNPGRRSGQGVESRCKSDRGGALKSRMHLRNQNIALGRGLLRSVFGPFFA